jgi:hypothetical protein
MPTTRQRGSSARTAANGSSRGRTGSNKASANRTKSTRRGSNDSRSSSQRATGAANRTSQASRSASRAKSSSSNGNHEAVRTVGASLAGATVGVVGGVLLGRTALQRRRKLPPKIDLTGVGQQIGEAGRQFARLAGEVRSVREKAEQIGRVLS